jgi:LysR family nitrogen assimilation transcriptional regulator
MRYQNPQMALLDLLKLQYFLHVAELGSFTKAAIVLDVAQSALSRHVRELEQQFGQALFHRTGRGVIPTDFAQQIIPRAHALILQSQQLTDDIMAAQGAPRGQVRLAMLRSLSSLLLTPLLIEISDRFPGIEMHVMEGLTDHVEEWLATGRADLGVLYGHRRAPSDIDELLMTADLYLIGRTDDPVVSSPEFKLSGISSLPMILPALPNRWRLSIERACSDHDIGLHVSYELDSIQTIKDLVSSGKRYSILPLHAVAQELDAGVLQASRIVEPNITRQVFLASSTQRPRSRASAEVAKVVRRLVATLIASGRLAGHI